MRPEFTEFTEYRDTMFDMLMHLLLATDKKSGHDRRSIRRFSIARNIQNGGFGLDVKNDFAALSDFERDTIADGLIALRESGFSFHLYGEICKRIFPNMILYLKIREEKALLVYHGEPETPRREAVARLCREFLLPADLKTDFYWDRHFGIFDIPETIRLDETVFV
jgi:hypothetical protein